MTEPPPARAIPVWRTVLRVLSFRFAREEMLAVDHRHLAVGLIATWLVGMGRYWDDPLANIFQHLGVGSVIYVFALTALLWLVMRPLCPDGLSYRRLLTFVTLTSLPAMLYAIPVERFFTLAIARSINVWFLAAVAAWRVALLVLYLARSTSWAACARKAPPTTTPTSSWWRSRCCRCLHFRCCCSGGAP